MPKGMRTTINADPDRENEGAVVGPLLPTCPVCEKEPSVNVRLDETIFQVVSFCGVRGPVATNREDAIAGWLTLVQP